jgi:hypothetical protein
MRFIVNNYQPQDEIFLFGFSRGAYTARSIAGLIGVIGLLPKQSMGSFLDAWAYFKLRPEDRTAHTEAFERRFHGRRTDVRVKCVGVWDTVGSLGIPTAGFVGRMHPCRSAYQFLNVELGTHVEHAFQALAIDEKRGSFDAAVWQARKHEVARTPEQVVRQVWFAGVHSDCGGGYPEHGASDLAYVWMASQVAPLLDLDEQCIRAELDRRELYNAGILHETMNLKWRLLGGGVNHRPIGKGLNETVHASVIARLDAGRYAPWRVADLRALPIEPMSPYEKQFAWEGRIPWQPLAPLLIKRPSICDWLVRALGGG